MKFEKLAKTGAISELASASDSNISYYFDFQA